MQAERPTPEGGSLPFPAATQEADNSKLCLLGVAVSVKRKVGGGEEEETPALLESCGHHYTQRVPRTNAKLLGNPGRRHNLVFAERETEAHRRKVTCPGPHTWGRARTLL